MTELSSPSVAMWPGLRQNEEFATTSVKKRPVDGGSSENSACLQHFPLFKGKAAFNNSFNLPHEQSDLRHGILAIGGDGLAMRAEDHKLMPRAGVRTGKAQRAQPADEVATFKWAPAGHSLPRSSQCRQ